MDKMSAIVNALGTMTMDEILNVCDMFSDCELEGLLDDGIKLINDNLLDKPINDWTDEERLVFILNECVGQIVGNRRKELNTKLDIM